MQPSLCRFRFSALRNRYDGLLTYLWNKTLKIITPRFSHLFLPVKEFRMVCSLSLSLSLHDSVRCFLKFVLPCFVGTLTDCRKIANRHWAVGEVLGQMTWVLNTYGRMHVWTHSISSHVVSWRDQTWWWRNADGRTELMPCWMSVLSPRH